MLGLGLPIGPFGTCATLGLNLYKLSHEVVRRLHLRPFRAIWVLRGVLSERSAGHVRTRTRAAQIVHVMRDAYIYICTKVPYPSPRDAYIYAHLTYFTFAYLPTYFAYFRGFCCSHQLLRPLPFSCIAIHVLNSFAIHVLNTMGAARLLCAFLSRLVNLHSCEMF